MNTFQKVIKYLAMAFAILLTVGIITAIVDLFRRLYLLLIVIMKKGRLWHGF